MTQVPASSHGGSSGPASGTYLPVSDQSGSAALDTTTYNDPIRGSGKLRALILAASRSALGIAVSGDAFPRWLMAGNAADGLYMGDGTFDPYTGAFVLCDVDPAATGHRGVGISSGSNTTSATRFDQISPRFTITAGALPTTQLQTAIASQLDGYRECESITPVTFNPGAATTATCTVALSPDGVTFSTLGVVTEPAGVAFDGTIHLIKVRVPAGWYIKLTVSATAVLGLTTYY